MKPRRAIKSQLDWLDYATPEAFRYTDQLVGIFSGTSTAGFAIVDKRLRYLAINKVLASFTGMPPDAHLGKTVNQVIPKLADKIEPICERVFFTGQPVWNFAVVGEGPAGPGAWIADAFPIKDDTGTVQQVAGLVVDAGKQRNLPPLLPTLTGMPPGMPDDAGQLQLLRRLIRLELAELSRNRLLVTPRQTAEALSVPLSSRELEILQLIAEGKSNKEISFSLSISVRTVETHRATLMRKLGLHTAVELARYAIRHGIVIL